MRYKSIRIEQTPDTHDFVITVSDIGGDRVMTNTRPNPLGYYIVQSERSSVVALEELKRCMAQDITRQIRDLQDCRDAILNLELEE